MAAIMQQLQAWVSASGILADKMAAIMIIVMVVFFKKKRWL